MLWGNQKWSRVKSEIWGIIGKPGELLEKSWETLKSGETWVVPGSTKIVQYISESSGRPRESQGAMMIAWRFV